MALVAANLYALGGRDRHREGDGKLALRPDRSGGFMLSLIGDRLVPNEEARPGRIEDIPIAAVGKALAEARVLNDSHHLVEYRRWTNL